MHISKEREKELKAYIKKIGLKFKNISLLNQSLCHSSYTYENKEERIESYERLEFLGDAVLKLAISDILFNKYKKDSEGQMSSKRACIVSDKTISGFAQKIELQNMVLTGKCEGETKQESIIACSFEALLGAIYLEGGYIKAKEFLIKNFNENILNVDIDNPKAKLQELTQKISHKLPVYKILEESGPSHDKIYKIGAYYNDELVGVGVAKNKKDAEFIAAQEAYTKLTGEGEE